MKHAELAGAHDLIHKPAVRNDGSRDRGNVASKDGGVWEEASAQGTDSQEAECGGGSASALHGRPGWDSGRSCAPTAGLQQDSKAV